MASINHSVNYRLPVNRRVTFSDSVKNARSESSITYKSTQSIQYALSSKKFSDPLKYEFSVACGPYGRWR